MQDKKFADASSGRLSRRAVSDLGMAAYIKMHGFRCLGRKSRNWYFEVDESTGNQFDQLTVDYINSQMHEFDSAIMSLKKMGEYLESE